MFEKATRLHIRYETNRGTITVEDLWDVPLTSRSGFDLDSIARSAHRDLKNSEEEVSFVVKSSKKNETAQLAFDVVKHVIEVKLAELDAATQAAAKKERKQNILAAIENKKNEALSQASVDELEAMLQEV